MSSTHPTAEPIVTGSSTIKEEQKSSTAAADEDDDMADAPEAPAHIRRSMVRSKLSRKRSKSVGRNGFLNWYPKDQTTTISESKDDRTNTAQTPNDSSSTTPSLISRQRESNCRLQYNPPANSTHPPPIASIGILTDIQCADLPDGSNYTKSEHRYYRHAFEATRRAIHAFQHAHESDPSIEVSAVIHFGDLIDGWNATQDDETKGETKGTTSKRVLAQLLDILPQPGESRIIPSTEELKKSRSAANSSATSPDASSSSPSHSFQQLRCYHVMGNHELMNFPRSHWANHLGIGKLAFHSVNEAKRRTPIKHIKNKRYQFPTIEHAHPEYIRKHSHDHHHHHSTKSDSHTKHQSKQPSQESHSSLLSASTSESMPVSSSIESTTASSTVDRSTLATDPSASTPSTSLEFTSAAPLYYDLIVANRYRIIVLDAYDIAILGYTDLSEPKHPSHTQAVEFLDNENPNENKYSPLHMPGKESRKVAYNGGLSQAQLEWLRSVLEDCQRLGHYAIICSHVAFHSRAAHITASIWNQHEILELIQVFRANIVACLHGHDHDGGHHVDENGIVHHTLEAILTTPPGRDAYGRMDFYEDHIEVVGVDYLRSFNIPVPAQPQADYFEKEEEYQRRLQAEESANKKNGKSSTTSSSASTSVVSVPTVAGPIQPSPDGTIEPIVDQKQTKSKCAIS